MKKVEITINGKAYPCRQTRGAMLRFKMETGKEVSDISNDVTDMCTYLFCCIASACKHDGVEFGLSRMDFADSVTLDDLAAWTEAINGDAAGVEASAEKKS